MFEEHAVANNITNVTANTTDHPAPFFGDVFQAISDAYRPVFVPVILILCISGFTGNFINIFVLTR
jgi:hypothetical protein